MPPVSTQLRAELTYNLPGGLEFNYTRPWRCSGIAGIVTFDSLNLNGSPRRPFCLEKEMKCAGCLGVLGRSYSSGPNYLGLFF